MAQSPDRKSGANDAGKGSGKGSGRKPPKASPGVRGPGGPPPRPSARAAQSGRPTMGARSAEPSDLRKKFEDFSYPLLTRMSAIPRWLVVVVPAALLLLGLIQTGPLSWLGGVLLLLVWVLLAWLTALSWPAITQGSRLLRVIVLIALLGIAGLKFTGRL